MKRKRLERPRERMQLIIEFADNGIILRNPNFMDDVMLVLTKEIAGTTDNTNEYNAIGKVVYDWLTEVAVGDHSSDWIATGAELSITATLTGRKM